VTLDEIREVDKELLAARYAAETNGEFRAGSVLGYGHEGDIALVQSTTSIC
jgi:hypothetical protein